MTTHLDPLDAAALIARDAEPPPLGAGDLDRMVGLAVAARHLRHEPLDAPSSGRTGYRSTGYRSIWVAAAAAALAAAFLAGVFASEDGTPSARLPSPSHDAVTPPRAVAVRTPQPVELANGDRLSPALGAEYTVEGTAGQRILRMHAGTMLVDAAHRSATERLSVLTPHGEVRVVGTVFSVDVDDERTVVRVYEGQVVVVSEGDERRIDPGGSVAVRRGVFELAPRLSDGERSLEDGVVAAVQRRASALSPVGVARVDEAAGDATEEPAAGADEPLPDTLPPPRPAFARLWIADGQPQRALDAARRALSDGRHGPTWRMVEGDALRALARPADAAVAYESAAIGYGPALAARAGLAAAELRLSELDDPTGALRDLEHFEAGAEPVIAGRIEALRARIRERRAQTDPSH